MTRTPYNLDSSEAIRDLVAFSLGMTPRRILSDEIGDILVSTIALQYPCETFETCVGMIREDSLTDTTLYRYYSEEAARAAHAEHVERLRREADDRR